MITVLSVLTSIVVVLLLAGRAAGAGATTTTTLTLTPNPGIAGRPITLAADVNSPSANPTGSVKFYNGSVLIASAPLTPVAGSTTDSSAEASVQLAAGSAYSIQAFYESNSLFAFTNSSSAPIALVVGSGPSATPTTTTLATSTATTITSREVVTLTAHVAMTGAAAVPSGAVVFIDNGLLLGTANLDVNGDARLLTGGYSAGANTVEADYTGTAAASPSTASVTLTVSPSATAHLTTTTLSTSTARSVTPRQTVTLVANVAEPTGTTTPTGQVAFVDNGILLASVRLDATGKATLVTGGFTGGSNTIEADYRGNANDTSSSAAITLTVSSPAGAHATTTTLATSTTRTVNPSQSVALTARVVAPGDAKALTGVVAFLDNGVPLGTARLDPSGKARIVTGGFARGGNDVEADYRGGLTTLPSRASVTLMGTGGAKRPHAIVSTHATSHTS